MHNSKNHLLDVIAQELRLPEIDPDACVYSIYDAADCQACIDACPKQAWILEDESLGLDTDACDGCGLCIPACPTGALHIHFPWVIRPLAGQTVALFACEQASLDEHADTLPCIHAIGLRQLLLLYSADIKYLFIATGSCETCSRHNAISVQQHLQQLNNLLIERDKPGMRIFQPSDRAWMRIFNTPEATDQGTQLSRRAFLHGGGSQVRHQLIRQDPLNSPESRTIPPGQLLPSTETTELHWPWAPQLDETRCNGCDVCIRFCPTDALQLIHDDEKSQPAYQLDPASCTGCGICVAACESQAIMIHSNALSAKHSIDLMQDNCSACGNTFHLPASHALSRNKLCRICQKHNHNSNLFQVLT